MRRLSRLITVLALAAAASQLAAQDPVYTWVDGNGVRHYAQTPPDGVKYEIRGVRDQTVGTEAAPVAQAPDTATAAAAAESAKDQQACERARLALEQLDSNVALQMDMDGDGTPETMNDDQRATQRRLAERAVRAFCNSGT